MFFFGGGWRFCLFFFFGGGEGSLEFFVFFKCRVLFRVCFVFNVSFCFHFSLCVCCCFKGFILFEFFNVLFGFLRCF